jgi:hypothetical protein
MLERRGLRVAAAGTLAALLSPCPLAFAHGESERETPVRTTTEGAAPDGEGAIDDEETHFTAGLDVVVGFGKTPSVDQTPPVSAIVAPVNLVESDPVQTDSFVFDFAYAPTKNRDFRARLPVTMGAIDPDAYQARTLSAIGNVELEGELAFQLSSELALSASLSIAFPTSQGSAVPAATAALPASFDPNAYDRYSLNYAAAASRGFEDDELFFSGRFGLVPKVAIEYRPASGFRLDSYAKLENLICVVDNSGTGYVGELVLAVHAGYRVSRYFEPGVRLWTTLELAGTSGASVGVVEPEIRFRVGNFTPYLGVILPFAGALAKDPSRFVGVRLGASLAF